MTAEVTKINYGGNVKQQILDDLEAYAQTTTAPKERAKLVEDLLRVVYDDVKFRQSEKERFDRDVENPERDSLGKVLDAARIHASNL